MKPSSARFWFLTVLSTLVCQPLLQAAAPRGTEPTSQDLKRVLAAEAEHNAATLNRRTELQPAVHPKTASDAEWWQAGFVKVGNAWLHAETAHQQVNTSLLQEYRAERDAAPKTAEGHIKLANWCQEHKLGEQERAHLLQVIVLSNSEAEQAPIFRRMGYRKVGQNWVSAAELQELQAKLRQDEQRLREWQQSLERIIRNWGANPKQHQQAKAELEGIEKPSAIPALLAASTINETLALAICEQLDKMPSFEASQALAVIAVQSEWPAVRKAATKCLKERKVDDFAPALLGEMRGLFSTGASTDAKTPRLIIREESDKYYVVDLRLLPGPNLVSVVHPVRGTIDEPVLSRFPGQPSKEGIAERSRFLASLDNEVQHRIDAENDVSEEYNKRAAAILSEVTGQEPSTSPQYWWAWWHLHTGTQAPPKQCLVDPRKVQLPPMLTFVRGCSCLVAGTQIPTDRGLVAVDKIQIGDQVLSKNIATGEITFKPVVHTTVREPVPVKRFVLNGQPVVSSSGHHFWVSGDGWKKTRELVEGQPIHTATGMTRIVSVVDEPEPAAVYNLVVADFHTYFVGPEMILSHDLGQPVPTNAKVPGLDPQ